MRPCLLALVAFQVHAATFNVIGSDPGPWPQILTSVGHREGTPARIIVARSGAPASDWNAKLATGAVLILEGESPLAASLGFRPTTEPLKLSSLHDVHRPTLPIILEHSIDLHRFQIPAKATVFATERWTGAPLIAGFRQGQGAVLWVIASPGQVGYERFPYILHALFDLGLEAPYQSRRLWAFFDYSYRTRVDLDYFAARWRKAGIGSLHVASWHFYEPDAEGDAYLTRLIEACHRNAITVYAWVELPHVSEKFWADHPEWREKTGLLQDAQLDWRKLMNLTNRDAFAAASSGVRNMVKRFDWDGVNLAELYFESLEGAANPARFTPMNDDVRAEFRASAEFDPIDIFGKRNDATSLRAFLDYRANLAHRMQEEWLTEIEKCREFRPGLDIVLTHVDDRYDTGMKDAIGADAARVLPMLSTRDFTFLIEDPATVWNLGPQRYPEIAKRYAPLTPKADRLAIDINVVDRYQDVYPTKQQTGAELFQLVHLAAGAFPRVALYFENSILQPDLPLLGTASAVVNRFETIGTKTTVDSPYGFGLPWKGPALVDGQLWPARNDATLWLPAGPHTVEPSAQPTTARLLDFNGTLESARSTAKALEFRYQSSTRAIAVLDHAPARIEVDGHTLETTGNSPSILLPRGAHKVLMVMN